MKITPTLCCLFREEDVKFKKFTLKSLEKLSDIQKLEKIDSIYVHNIETLQLALDTCKKLGIGSYRIGSDLLPSYNFSIENDLLPQSFIEKYKKKLSNIETHGIILSMHPDQFCILNSLREDVIKNSLEILDYHFFLGGLLPIDSINIHVGGVYGDKVSAKKRFIETVNALSQEQKNLLTIENDEKSYSVDDILEIVRETGIRPTIDIHHHKVMERDNPKPLRNQLLLARDVWKTNGYDYIQCHISSPRDDRYQTLRGSQPHHDYILEEDYFDFSFLDCHVVLDIEAKAKELAVRDFNRSYNASSIH